MAQILKDKKKPRITRIARIFLKDKKEFATEEKEDTDGTEKRIKKLKNGMSPTATLICGSFGFAQDDKSKTSLN